MFDWRRAAGMTLYNMPTVDNLTATGDDLTTTTAIGMIIVWRRHLKVVVPC